MSNEIVTCKSCNNQFSGYYCNACGEKVIDQKDRTLKYFLGEFINAITFADNKLWRTLKCMLVSPGKFSRDFVEGRRRTYMKPVSIFFLANLIYFLIPTFNTFNTNLNVQLTAFNHSKLAKEMVRNEIEERGIAFEDYREIYNQKTSELSKLLLILMAVILGLFFWPIHIGSDKNLLADHFTFGLEVMSFITLFCVVALAIILSSFSLVGLTLDTDVILSSIDGLLLLYFFYHAEKMLYGFKGFRRVMNSFLCVFVVLIALIIYRAFLFFITFWSI